MNTVLIVTHHPAQCGVYQYGYNTARAIEASTKFRFIHAPCSGLPQLLGYVSKHNPCAIIYNYHVSVLGWVNSSTLTRLDSIKSLFIHHEPFGQRLPDNADAIISQDSSDLEQGNTYVVPRILHDYSGPVPKNSVPTFGSFGFGLSGKGFDRIVQRVCQEYNEARIRFHIPFATYGDPHGTQAKSWAQAAKKNRTKEGVILEIDHEWWNTQQLLEFLAGNDLNIFMYDDMGRGSSGVLDFALSVPRPIAITASTMFRHVWRKERSVLLEENTLIDIYNRGTQPLKVFYEEWNRQNLLEAYERIITEVCHYE